MGNTVLSSKHKEQALTQRILQLEAQRYGAELDIETYRAFQAANPDEAEGWSGKIEEEEAKIARLNIALGVATRQLQSLNTGLAVK